MQTLKDKCTLADEQLIAAVNGWVKKLADTGGNAWSLQVPVNIDEDPDVLIVELGQRLQKLKEQHFNTQPSLRWVNVSERNPTKKCDYWCALPENYKLTLYWDGKGFIDPERGKYYEVLTWLEEDAPAVAPVEPYKDIELKEAAIAFSKWYFGQLYNVMHGSLKGKTVEELYDIYINP